MRPIMVSWRMLGWLGLLATVAVAGCTATSTSSPAASGHGRSASLAAIAAVPPGATSGAAPAGPGAAAPPAVVTAARWGIGQCLRAKPVSHQVWWARVTNGVWSRLSHGGPPGDFPLYVAEISGDFACPSYFRGTFHTRLLTVTVPVNGTRANPARFECGLGGEVYPVRKLPGAQVFTLGGQQASSPAPRTC